MALRDKWIPNYAFKLGSFDVRRIGRNRCSCYLVLVLLWLPSFIVPTSLDYTINATRLLSRAFSWRVVLTWPRYMFYILLPFWPCCGKLLLLVFLVLLLLLLPSLVRLRGLCIFTLVIDSVLFFSSQLAILRGLFKFIFLVWLIRFAFVPVDNIAFGEVAKLLFLLNLLKLL